MPLILTSFGCGLLFGAGLLISGMTQPDKVLGFLDLFGAWDATLAFVMAGAVTPASRERRRETSTCTCRSRPTSASCATSTTS